MGMKHDPDPDPWNDPDPLRLGFVGDGRKGIVPTLDEIFPVGGEEGLRKRQEQKEEDDHTLDVLRYLGRPDMPEAFGGSMPPKMPTLQDIADHINADEHDPRDEVVRLR